MSVNGKKSQREPAMFQEFAKRSSLPIVPNSIENRDSPEPDMLCKISGEGPVAFELKEICSSNIAKVVSYLQSGHDQEPKYIRGDSSDDLRAFLEKVRDKKYKSDFRIELLFYADGRDGFPPDVIIPTIQSVFDAKPHCFTRVWFMGGPDDTCECAFPV